MAHLWFDSQRYWVRIPAGSAICHRDCAYTVLQTVLMPGVHSEVLGSNSDRGGCLSMVLCIYSAPNYSNACSVLRGTGFESRLGRMVVIGVLHIQCSKLFKGLKYASMHYREL